MSLVSQQDDEDFLATTIGIEKEINPFFLVFKKEWRERFNMEEKELFIHLRSLRDNW